MRERERETVMNSIFSFSMEKPGPNEKRTFGKLPSATSARMSLPFTETTTVFASVAAKRDMRAPARAREMRYAFCRNSS